MAETLLTIQEAAEISGKSIQTIRRALKSNKLEAKKRKTPQGFNYLITQESLVAFYKIKDISSQREQGSIKSTDSKTQSKNVSNEFATVDDLKKFEEDFHELLNENKKEKEKFMNFMKAFQDRFVVMENRFKLLEQPKKRWYKFWG